MTVILLSSSEQTANGWLVDDIIYHHLSILSHQTTDELMVGSSLTSLSIDITNSSSESNSPLPMAKSHKRQPLIMNKHCLI